MNNALDTTGFNLFDLGNWFAKFFASLLMTIVQWGCLFVFLLESVFWAFARGISVDGGATYTNLFDLLLFENGKIREASLITQLSIYFILIGAALVVLMAVIAIIRSHISLKDEDHNPSTAILGVVKAVVLMIAVPFIVYAISKVTNALIDGICRYPGVNISTTASGSFANKIFFMFSSGNMADYKNADGSYSFSFMLSETAFTSQMGDMTTWETLAKIGFVQLGDNQGLTGYNYLLAIVVVVILCIALFKAVLLLGDRMLDLTVLYIIAPLPIACYPADEGKRYDVWKELIISKLLASLGFTIAFIVYFVFCDEIYARFAAWNQNFTYISWTLENGEFNQATILTIVYIVFVVAGGLSVPAVYSMLAQLVGQTAGRVASDDLNNANQDIGHIQRGLSMVGAGVGAASVGALALGKAGVFGSGKGAGAKSLANGGVNATQSMLSKGLGSPNGGGFALAGAGANASGGKLRSSNVVARGFGNVGRAVGSAGSYFAAHGVLGSLGGGLSAVGSKITSGREGKLNDLINQAVSNYNNKDKLGALNKQITKMGGRKVDDSYIASRLQQQKETEKQSKMAANGFKSLDRLNTKGSEGRRLANEMNPAIKAQKKGLNPSLTRTDAKKRLGLLKDEKKASKKRKD